MRFVELEIPLGIQMELVGSWEYESGAWSGGWLGLEIQLWWSLARGQKYRQRRAHDPGKIANAFKP